MSRSEKKIGNFGQLAQEAWDAGRMVFTPRITFSHLSNSAEGDDIAQAIESIMAVGWRIQGWAASAEVGKTAVALPLFVRP